jgi:hypothetical protein
MASIMHLVIMNTKKSTAGTSGDETTAPKLRYEPKPKGSWKKIIGVLKDCEESKEAFRLGAEWRARMNREGH